MANINTNVEQHQITSNVQFEIGPEGQRTEIDIPIIFDYETFELDINLQEAINTEEVCNSLTGITSNFLQQQGLSGDELNLAEILATETCREQLPGIVTDIDDLLNPEAALNRKIQGLRRLANLKAEELLSQLPSPRPRPGLPGPPEGATIAPVFKEVTNINGREGVRGTNIIRIPYKQEVQLDVRVVAQGVTLEEEAGAIWLYQNTGSKRNINLLDVLPVFSNLRGVPGDCNFQEGALVCSGESGITPEYARVDFTMRFVLNRGFYVLMIGNTDTGGHNQIEARLNYNIITQSPSVVPGISNILLFGGGLSLGLLLFLLGRGR